MLKITALLAFFSIGCYSVHAQGCSDAGFCTMGAMRPDQDYSKRIDLKLRSITYNYYNGKSNISPRITAHTIDVNFTLNDLNTIQVKLPYQSVRGNLGNTSGLGDISISVTRFIKTVKGGDLQATAGLKLPTGNSSIEDGAGRHFPMYYQTTLGTFDIVAGASWINENWLLATGIQIPFGANGNEFRLEEWPEYPDQNYLAKNDPAFNLRRGTDIMLRVERNFRYLNWNFSLGLLPIWRINRDRILDETTNEYVKVDQTRGLALSGLVGLGYQFNVRNGIKFIHGHQLQDREINPDGLTRKFVNSLSFIHRF
jgi:hypothetical protein